MNAREDIYAALFDLVITAPDLVTTSRKLRHWSEVNPTEMPALFQAQAGQDAMPMNGRPTRWVLGATLWIYVNTEGALNPGTVVNPIVDAIAAALDNTAVAPQRLGGLVEWARIEGTIETSEGTLGNIEVVRIPVRMLTA